MEIKRGMFIDVGTFPVCLKNNMYKMSIYKRHLKIYNKKNLCFFIKDTMN